MTSKSGRYEDEWLTRSFCPYLFHSLFSLLVFLSVSFSSYRRFAFRLSDIPHYISYFLTS